MSRYKYDVSAVALLVLLWALFFWRLLTPIAADQASFAQGDFSAQFVAFGGYQYERLIAGEIPLWNPYNNGGLPFIADTQAAVFYPPRLLTIAVASLLDGWSYHALELEAIFHVLLFSLLTYLFVRRLTWDAPQSVFGAFVAAIITGYGGFTAGYPPLQLALLESAVWLPLAALGIFEATRDEALGWRCLALAGLALGLSWMAGHPQTAWFSTYLLVAWLGYRVYLRRWGWSRFLLGTVLMGVVTLGVTAVTFVPGVEYLILASRAELGFAAKDGGFPLQDILQFIYPTDAISLFSPLYVGIPALIFAFAAGRYRLPNAVFWLGAAALALLHSFGGGTLLYHALYNVLPGLRFFRGQERAAFVVATSLAVAAGIGAAYIGTWQRDKSVSVYDFMRGLLVLVGGLSALIVVGWLGGVGERFGQVAGTAVFATMITGTAVALIVWQQTSSRRLPLLLLAMVVVFELFSVNMYAVSNYENMPPHEQLSMEPPPLVQTMLDDAPDEPFRVDGFRGLEGNYGSLYGVMDMRGISPLFFQPAQDIIYRDYINNPLAWELFAVRYIFSERDSFGSVTTDVLAEDVDRAGTVTLHELADPRPYAHLVYQADVVDSDAFAAALLNDPRYEPRQSVIVQGELPFTLPDTPPENASAEITQYAPEQVTVTIDTPENVLLSLAHVDYPGWEATLNDEPVAHLRAYGALIAVPIPAGEHTLTLTYDPLTYRIGAILSLVTWAALSILALVGFFRR